jgi:protein gp37
MAGKSHIEWTEATWNPVTGCTKVSAGCKNCYAERMAFRLQAMGNARYLNAFKLTLHEDLLDAPRKWKKPRVIFVNSMSDLFHKEVPTSFIKRAFETMNACPQHTFQILTKRSGRLKQIAGKLQWTKNIWMGVSVEDDRVYQRIHDLVEVPAYVRFLSCEPLIGPTENLPLGGIHWVIVGGESGPNARPMKEEWVRSIKEQCSTAGSAFFFKQWGGVQKHRYGRELDGKTFDEMPVLA